MQTCQYFEDEVTKLKTQLEKLKKQNSDKIEKMKSEWATKE